MKSKLSIQQEIVHWVLLLAPFAFIAWNWDIIPDKVAIHFNMAGEPDGWGSKSSVFIMPMISLALYPLFLFLPRMDPKIEQKESFFKAYWIIRLVLSAFFSVLGFVIAFNAIGEDINLVNAVVNWGLVLLFFVLGNYMSKFKPNYFIGIRTPWTLESENTWYKTHRFGAKLFVAFSILCALSLLIDKYYFLYVVVGGSLTVTVLLFVYSYKVYKKEKQLKVES